MRLATGLPIALLAVGLVPVLTACAVPSGRTQSVATPAQPSGAPTLRAAGLAMGGSWTESQVRRYASEFDAVVVGASARAGRVRLFHSTHPGILVLAYTCGFDVHDQTPFYAWVNDQHPGWFLTDAGGRRLHAYRDRHRWALDCGLPEVRAFFADSARRRVQAIGADGIFEDNVMPTWDIKNLAAGAARLGRYASAAEWRAALDLYLATVEEAVAPALVAANQVAPWTRHAQIVAVEGMPAGGAAWEELLRGLAAVARDTTRVPFLVHYLNGPDDAARAFVTASYLMAVEPGALLCLSYEGPRDSVRRLPEQSLALGRPLGAARQQDGVWWRDFERARVLVNPTAETRPAPWPAASRAGRGPALPARSAGIAWRPDGPGPAPAPAPALRAGTRRAGTPQPRLAYWVSP